MNRTKFFAFLTISAILFACGSQDDGGGPPKLKEPSGIVTISPFDTLTVVFDSDIVLKEGDSFILSENENFTGNQPVKIVYLDANKTTDSRIRLVGDYGNTSGTPPLSYFKPATIHTINFSKVKNTTGHEAQNVSINFHTHPILDKLDNNNKTTADIIPTEVTDREGVTFAGLLGYEREPDLYDVADFFVLELKYRDSLSIKATTHLKDSINVDVIIPVYGKSDSTITIKEFKVVNNKLEKSIVYEVGDDYWYGSEGLINPSTKVPFYIKISPLNVKDKAIPYLLNVRVK